MIDLKSFCRVDTEEFSTPFSVGDKSYATNGVILVCVPRVDGIECREDAPKLGDRLPFDHDEITDWRPLPGLTDDQKKDTCGFCKGHGFVRTCQECGGHGAVYFSNDYNNYECMCESCCGDGDHGVTAETSGAISCPGCNGTKLRGDAVDVGRNKHDGLNTIYIAKAQELPGVVFSLAGDELSPFRFKFDGGVGLIMPMRLPVDK